MRYRTLTFAAVLVALLGTAGPALADHDWDYGRRHDRWHHRNDRHRHHDHDRHYGGWYSRPHYFWNRSYYYPGGYRSYDSDSDCYHRPYWGGDRWWDD